MEKRSLADIRNVTLAGHGNCGKTTLSEAMLFAAKATGRRGSVQDGTTVSDFTPIEKERHNSVSASVMHYEWKNTLVNLIDTPGYMDFMGEAISGIKASDVVLVTIAAAAGVQVNTRATWKAAQNAGKSLAIVVTKLDVENVSFAQALEGIQANFGKNCVAVSVPKNEGPSISAIEDVFESKGGLDEWREALVEALVESDDDLMEKYLEGQSLDPAKLRAAFRKGMVKRSFIPVFSVVAEKDIGVELLMNYIASDFPTAADVVSFKGRSGDGQPDEDIVPSDSGPFIAQVFKTVTDDYVGKLSYFRVISGRADSESQVVMGRSAKKVKMQNIFLIQGKEQKPVTEVTAGNIYSVSKVEDLNISETLCQATKPYRLSELVFPEPMVFLAVSPKARQDEQRISGSLAKLCEEDPTFKVTRSIETSETVATGMSQLHLDIKFKTLKARFGVEIVTKQPRIPYRETITAKASTKYRHKKQTGGAGQFAEVWLRVEPLRSPEGRYEGFEFDSEVFGGAISTSFIPSIEKGVRAVLKTGAVAGYAIDGVKAVVYDGKEHPVDSKDIAFQIAGREAFKLAVKDAKPVLLEPIMDVEVSVSASYMGEVTGDLNTRRGRIQGMNSEGQWQVISAKVPQAEIMAYSTDLRSMTGGEGFYTMKFSHYDVVPSNIAAEIIAKSARKEEESDAD